MILRWLSALGVVTLVGVAACTLSRSGSLEQTCSSLADCDDGTRCTEDLCNPQGLCEHTSVDGSAHLDQVAYDCKRLFCENGREVSEPDDDDVEHAACILYTCHEGELLESYEPPGTLCDEGQGSGTCDQGVCIIVCDPNDPNWVEVCDDHNDCTIDSCDAVSKTCSRRELDNEESTTPDEPQNCRINLCIGGEELENEIDNTDLPNDNEACTDDECVDGNPVFIPFDQDTICSGGFCNASGECVDCNDAVQCPGQDSFCQARTCINETCGLSNTPNNTPLPQSQQTAGPCKEIQCDGAGGTKIVNRPNGTGCSDQIFCNGTDTCDNGDCTVHAGNPCPGPDGDANCSESCNESADDCSLADPNGAACNDALFCNGTDTCGGGSCSLHTGNPCPGPDGDGNCTESCSEANDNCLAPDTNGSACTDGVFCNGVDSCNSGSCSTHAGDPCPGVDGDGNCAESCDETADNCNGADPNGSACSDGLFCSGTETCSGGACTGSTGNPCPGHNAGPLCNDSCSESADSCTANDAPATSCSDGAFCNGAETCNGSGSCVAPGNPCPGHNAGPLCNDSCNETADDCTANDLALTSCDDGLFCNGTETCSAGACTNSTGNPCPGQNVGPSCSDSCSESTSSCSGHDVDGTICGQVQVCSLGMCVSGCGTDLVPLAATTCPPGCNSCDLVNGICFIDCIASNSCQSMTLACPADWACVVNCSGNAACQSATITCPSLYGCDVSCSSNGACSGLTVDCPTEGTCNLACTSGNTSTCANAVLDCASSLNECTAACSVGGPVTANCNGASACGCSGCP